MRPTPPPGALRSWLLCALLALAAPAAGQTDFLSVDDVEPGMVGEGRTAFHGETIETFEVEILGVLEGAMAGRSIILASLSGGPLAHTGVMQGMSGSPVYVDGRLLGAVAYAFPFAKDAIAGITPFEEMVRFTEEPLGSAGTPAGSGGLVGVASTPRLHFDERGAPSFDPAPPGTLADAAPPDLAAASSQLVPILTPVAASGLSPEAHATLAPLFRQLGMQLGNTSLPFPQGPSSALAEEGSQPLAPGSPVGATLIGGDLVLMAGGTVTHVDELTGEVFAFGHPFTGLGTMSIPMQAARVEASVASLSNSFRMTSAGPAIGVWRQDRETGIRGRLGLRARTIPLSVEVTGSRGGRRRYDLELVDHELYTPLLAYSGLISILSQEERPAGAQTLDLRARIGIPEGRTLPVGDVFASGTGGVALSAAALVAAPLALLLSNPVERVPVRSIEVEVTASERARTATLTRAWLQSSRVRAGETATLRVATRDYRGSERVREIEAPIPANAAGRRLQLVVADALGASLQDQRMGVNRTPSRLEQIYRAIGRRRQQSRLYVRLVGGGGSAAVVAGEYLPSLPPSVRSVMSRDTSGGIARPVASSVLWEGHLDFDAAVSGFQQVTFQVESR